MATRHFKQSKYGKVKPVKKEEETLPKPLTMDLRFMYRKLETANDAELMDMVANIVRWFEDFAVWQLHKSNKKKYPQTTMQAKIMTQGIQLKKVAQSSATRQFEAFVKYFEVMEKYVSSIMKIHPSIKEVTLNRKEKIKKVQVQVDRIQPRFEKLVNLLHAMFPQSGLSIEVVPKIISPSGKALAWKYDHELSRVFYAKDRAKQMVITIRREGLLRVALTEAMVLARAKAFTGFKEGNYMYNPEACLVNLEKNLDSIVSWAKSGPKPKKLVRLPKVRKAKDNGTVPDRNEGEATVVKKPKTKSVEQVAARASAS